MGDSQWRSHGIEGRRKDDIKNDNFHDNLACSDGKNNEIMNLKVLSVELTHLKRLT